MPAEHRLGGEGWGNPLVGRSDGGNRTGAADAGHFTQRLGRGDRGSRPDHAAATLAAIYQRADLIHSAGGYLRNLVTRARNGQFTVWPMLMALLRAKLEGEAYEGRG